MPLPFLLTLAAAAAPSVYKGIAGLNQRDKKVEQRDTTPEAFKESLALTRQQAASNRMPGQAEAENRILQGTAAVNAGALRAGGSSSDVLASLAASDAQQKQALSGLTTQATAYQQHQQSALHQMLLKQASYQKADQQAADLERGALKEASERNIFSGVDGLSQVAVYALNRGSGNGSSGSTPPIPNSSAAPRKRATHDAFGYLIPKELRGIIG